MLNRGASLRPTPHRSPTGKARNAVPRLLVSTRSNHPVGTLGHLVGQLGQRLRGPDADAVGNAGPAVHTLPQITGESLAVPRSLQIDEAEGSGLIGATVLMEGLGPSMRRAR